MKTNTKSNAPRQLSAIQTSRHFHVSHHRHSGRVLPRRETSYPLLTMILLCVGVLIGGWTHIVAAAANPYGPPQSNGYTVQASVPGPAPTQPASIDSPVSGTHFTDKPVIIRGSCPADAGGGYVSVYRNGFYSGSALCDASNQYQLSIDLFGGGNQLIAKVHNFTDVPGPVSAPIAVYYDPPQPSVIPDTPTPATSTSSRSKPATQGFSVNAAPNSSAPVTTISPLTLSTDFTIRGYYIGQQSIWQLNLEGGTSPYALAIDWGDGSNSVASRGEAGQVRLTHTYEKPGGYHGSYVVKFTATDAAGSQTYLQLLVIVNSRLPSPVGTTQPNDGGYASGMLHTLRNYVWPSYGVVVLMLASYWLGERREYRVLKPRLRRTRHA